jgi:enoyl-[acyl-carrier-protein] reductase (NADH)
MKYKQLILRKIYELNNLINSQRALVSTARSQDEIHAQLDRVKSKLEEIEVLIHSESEN